MRQRHPEYQLGIRFSHLHVALTGINRLQEMQLRSLTAKITVSGCSSLTSLIMQFHNPNRRVLEGERAIVLG